MVVSIRIQIHTTFPQLEINCVWPRLEINQQYPQIQIETHGPNITIDQEAAKADIGLANVQYFNDEIKTLSRAAILEGIKRYAQDGDRIVRSVGKMDMRKVLGQMVKERDRERIPEINIDVIPKTRPRLQFDYGIQIDWLPGWLDIQPIIQPPEIKWYLGQVEINTVGVLYDVWG